MATNKQLFAVLSAIPLFEGLSQKHLKKIAAIAQIANFMQGATVVQQGVIGDSFYVILTGQAKVAVNGRTVHHLLPGDHFGEISLLDGRERTASVVTETPATLLEVTQKQFFDMLAKDADISIAILEALARAVRRVDRTLAR